MFSRVFSFALLLAALAAGACASSQGQPMPALTFAHLDRIGINVGAVRTEDARGYSAEGFVTPPGKVIERYFHARFAPKGFAGSLLAMIEEAAVAHGHEPAPVKPAQYLNVGGRDVYNMHVKIRLEHQDESGQALSGTVLTGRRILKVSEHASIAARERAQLEAMEKLLGDLDREVLRVVLADMRLALP